MSGPEEAPEDTPALPLTDAEKAWLKARAEASAAQKIALADLRAKQTAGAF